eukprot:m.112751 g.112751  ORF g.112751 m.112751 type:complete len:289 (-) comp13487_c0_seq3:266-1132(-)
MADVADDVPVTMDNSEDKVADPLLDAGSGAGDQQTKDEKANGATKESTSETGRVDEAEDEAEDDDDDVRRKRAPPTSEKAAAAPAASSIVIPKPLDRTKACPLLLRVFCREHGHHRIDEFRNGATPAGELHMYTWMDASLKELALLVKEHMATGRRPGAQFRFAAVTKHKGKFVFNHLGQVTNDEESESDSKTLQSLNFRIGDFMDVAVIPPFQRRDSTERRGRGSGRRVGQDERQAGGRLSGRLGARRDDRRDDRDQDRRPPPRDYDRRGGDARGGEREPKWRSDRR